MQENSTAYVGASAHLSAELTDDELSEMWRTYFDGDRRDVRLRDRLVTHYFPLTLRVAAKEVRRYPAHADRDSFESWAQAGLLRAAANYDPHPRINPKTGKMPSRPVTFETYAVASMKSCIMDGIRSLDWAPRSLRTRQRDIDNARRALEQELGRRPTDAETGARLGVDVDLISRTDAETASSWHVYAEEHSQLLADTPDPEPQEEGEAARTVREAAAAEVHRLPRVQRTVLALHYFEEMPLDEVARALGTKTGYVSQVHAQAVLQVHESMMRAVGVSVLHTN